MSRTHEVTNQVPPLVDYDVAGADHALVEGVERHADWAVEGLAELGRLAGSEPAQRWGREANEFPPRLLTHDRYGNRIDEVEFHPSWHRLMEVAVGAGLHAAPWQHPTPGAHVDRAARFYTWSQVEGGHGCPISMTYAAVPALKMEPAVAATWVPRLTAPTYDFGLRSPGAKLGCLAGMGMTEKQGGSDVRANTTRAVPTGADGEYLLTGHKWFCSAPMCDMFLVLAQAPGGLTCFLVPRVLEDGTRNPFRLQRLKDKLGNRSNASSEVEFEDTWSVRIGPEGRGVPTIIEMVTLTRLDCVTGSAALIRQSVAQACHHARHRRAFGDYLVDKPLMNAVLADLAVESEAATTLMLRLAAAVDAADDPVEAAFARLALAAGKYWVCKRGAAVTAEALECLGGNGFVEESGMPRLYREAPLNSIWEGSGNVNALDVLRALGKEPESVVAFEAELAHARGGDRRLDAEADALRGDLAEAAADPVGAQRTARRLVERIALVLQGTLLVRFAPPAVADAFCASRLGGDWGHAFGTLPRGTDTASIVERATPKPG
ncbi:MAG TPA: acyl-CoA dehydrogenase family protein [Mycobacteriales bacterium]|nr:acyl-CoA dehydrogenase family protein [Mycobacteriales bacterium]